MTKKSFVCFSRYIKIVCVGFAILINTSNAQTRLPLSDLSFFKSPSTNWRIAGDVNADLNTKGLLMVKEGAGVLVNMPVNGGASADLFSNQEFGDMDLELDYMMAKGSNSGIYLQGKYEIQLLDCWGFSIPNQVIMEAYMNDGMKANLARTKRI